jgi:hypothetical protein
VNFARRGSHMIPEFSAQTRVKPMSSLGPSAGLAKDPARTSEHETSARWL